MDVEKLKVHYDKLSIKLEKLRQEVIYILSEGIKRESIPIHIVDSRIKSFDSLVEKTKRLDLKSPFDEINDLCGARIICLFLSDLGQLEKVVKSSFDVLKTDDKVDSKPEEQFGYLSIHYLCKLPKSFAGPRYDDLKDLSFEIQIRTIAMHAWATISHYLDYKSPQAIPSELRKDFQALSGLFYVADSHFELFFRSSSKSRIQAQRRIEHGSDLSKEEVNLDTFTAFLRTKFDKREHGDTQAVSILLHEIVAAGYKSLAEIETDLEKAAEAFEYYESKYPPGAKSKKFKDVGVARVSLSIANENFLKVRRGINDKIERILDARKKL